MNVQEKCLDNPSAFGEHPINSCVDLHSLLTASECRSTDSLNVKIKQELIDDTDQNLDTDTPFPFETDQAALKDNKDYQNLLRALVVLESQRSMALRDYETLVQMQQKALLDPIAFVQKLQQKVDLGIPKPQKVEELPSISWDNYSVSLKAVFDSYNSKHLTRRKYKRELLNDVKEENDDVLSHSETKLTAGSSAVNKLSKTDDVIPSMRGEVSADDSRSYGGGTFNRPWSVDEQKQLEALLLKYPSERFESRRWAKIARELGNRTPQQVASRVQKYFIKLAKLSLPIPGRMPNLAAYGGKGSYHKHHRYNRFYYPSSTFMASYEPPVFMSEEDCDAGIGCSTKSSFATAAAGQLFNYGEDSYSSPKKAKLQEPTYTQTQSEKLLLTGKVRSSSRSRSKDQDSETKPDDFARDSLEYSDSEFHMNRQFSHTSEQKCISCSCVIADICWQCVECPAGQIVLCMACSKCNFSKGGHSSKHLLNRIGCRSN